MLYIKLLPGGKFVTGLVNGPAEIYDSVNKYVQKGNFIKSRLNDLSGTVIDYDHPEHVLFQLCGSFVGGVANGAMTRIYYNGPNTLDEILDISVSAVMENCTYSNGNLVSIESSQTINISFIYARHPTRGYFTNLVLVVS